MHSPITRSASTGPAKKYFTDYMTVESGFYSYVVFGGLLGGVISLWKQGAFENKYTSRPTYFGRGSLSSSDDSGDDDDADDQLFTTSNRGPGGGSVGSAYSTRSPATLSAIRQSSTKAQEALAEIDSLQRNVNTHYFADARY